MAKAQLGRAQIAAGVFASALMWFGLYAGLGITSIPTDEAGGTWSRLSISAGIAIAFFILALCPSIIGNAKKRWTATLFFAAFALASHLGMLQNVAFPAMIALNVVRGLGNGFVYAQMGAFLFMLTASQSALALSVAMCLAGIGSLAVEPLGFDVIDTVLMYTKIATLALFLALPFSEEKRTGPATIARTAPQTVPMYVELFLLSIVYGLIATVFVQFEQAAELQGIPLVARGLAYIAPAVVLVIAVLRKRRIDFFSVRWLLLPLMAAFLVPLLIGNLAVSLAVELVLLALFQVLEAASTISFIEIDREYNLPPVSSFATLRVGGTLGILLGRALAFAIVSPSLNAAIAQAGSLDTPAFEITIAAILMSLIIWRTFLRYPNFEYGAVPSSAFAAEDEDAGGQNSCEESQDAAKTGIWRRKCDAFARAFDLSPREKDVLRLLARGRNAVFIGKELYISESTVRTHISHIYQKADVHSQQELINLVESQPS